MRAGPRTSQNLAIAILKAPRLQPTINLQRAVWLAIMWKAVPCKLQKFKLQASSHYCFLVIYKSSMFLLILLHCNISGGIQNTDISCVFFQSQDSA